MDDIPLDDSEDPEYYMDEYNNGYQSRRSVNTSNYNTTFRDTDLSEATGMKTLQIQSLTSIVNHPGELNTLSSRVKTAVKNKILGKKYAKKNGPKFFYKPLREQDIPESPFIPKVNYPKDFERAVLNRHGSAMAYASNRDQEQARLDKAAEQNPFASVGQNLSGSGRASIGRGQEEVVIVPEHFYREDYKIDHDMLRKPAETDTHTAQLQKYLSLVDNDLEKAISVNFDFFNRAFNHIDEMKEDMTQVGQKTASIRECNKQLRRDQILNMVKVYRLQRKKLNIARISEILRYSTVLQQSVPVISNLIENSDAISGFEMAISIIKNANDLVDTKLKNIKFTYKYAYEIANLKS